VTLKTPQNRGPLSQTEPKAQRVLPTFLWGIAILMIALAVYLGLTRTKTVFSQSPASQPTRASLVPTQASASSQAVLPKLAPTTVVAVNRSNELHTDIPKRSKVEGQSYTVENGDSVFALSEYFRLKPETILWANYDVLNDNPDYLNIGQKLYIPPTDGVVHKWKDGDTFDSVASLYKANVKEILLWPGNHLDMVTPIVTPGTLVMVPGGQREYRRAWIVPTIPRGAAGVATNFPGTCDTGTGGAIGTGSFIWPGPAHSISGNTYWSGHLAIDIAIGVGTPVSAADGGVVVFSGWSAVGYGNMVMIDHGNGFQTLYAHLTAAMVRCGQSVGRGQTIGTGGSTGNSTGPHLHFEMRYMGGFVNPMGYLH
jgi:murein DD-endopeptidase MepM/ murein hydrolase activator NlpD